jgi:asparagine synthase (glutamine-hydrolysing)
VCGVFFTNSTKDSSSQEISPSLRLRGPDSANTLLDPDFSILFTRLAIRDLEGGEQPYVTSNGSYICAINGELYNMDHVRLSLYSSKDSGPLGDMQLLAEYLSLDLSNIKNARGMFAGFIFDVANKKLSFFRDSIGEKPLYYFCSEGVITVSSTIAAIVEQYGYDFFNVNESSLYKGHSSPGSTIFVEIQEVLPGEYIVFDFQSVTITKTKYWNWPIRKFNNPSKNQDLNFEENLLAATLSTSIADVPICMLLSGGLDSAAVLSALGKVYQTQIPSFTLAFENRSFDESLMAKLSADSLNSRHHIIQASNKDFARFIPKMLDDLDSPILDPAFLPLNYLTDIIKKNFGFKVAITGDGGDELFRGYELFKVRNRINIVSSRGIAPVAHKLIGLLHPLFAGSEKRNSLEFLMMRLDSVLQNSEIPWFETALSPYAGTRLFPIFTKDLNAPEISRSTKKKILQEDIENFYCNEILPQVYLKKSDNGSMVNGMELRIPLLHQQMIEFAFLIPSCKLENNAHKWLIRDYLKDKVPKQVLNQKKHGFSVPLSGILDALEKPDWNLGEIGLSLNTCDSVWIKACNGDANAARAGFALMILNNYLNRWK